LLRFTRRPSSISLTLFMLQREVARRLSASPSTHDYGALTLRVQLQHHVKYLRTIPASVFIPQPEVDSSVVAISPRDAAELPQYDDRLLLKLITVGFAQRRKQLQKLLREYVKDWDAAAHAIGIVPNARAEELSLLQWIALANFVAPPPSSDTRLTEDELFPVVDQNDRIQRFVKRSEVHGNNLRHRAVHILLFNQNNEVFLQQRSRSKDRHPLKWDSSAAGHVAAGENYDETARRELMEELGISVALRKISKLPASRHTDQEFVWLYQGTVSGDLTPNKAEIEQGAFFPAPIVDGWTSVRPEDFAPAFLECWRVYRHDVRSSGASANGLAERGGSMCCQSAH
jgi:16S rRNA (adenine1518-N6/adenine1519-N6)-dimethyltransferase